MAVQLSAQRQSWKLVKRLWPSSRLRICSNCAYYLKQNGFHCAPIRYQKPAEQSPSSFNPHVEQNNETSQKGVEENQNTGDLHRRTEPKLNPVKIQMLADSMQEQLFKDCTPRPLLRDKFHEIVSHLSQHELWGKPTTLEDEIAFQLPKLHGENIEEHFYNLAKQQSKPYFEHAEGLANLKLPPKPSQWIFKRGWTKYDAKTRTCKAVDCPDTDAMVFDVEVLVGEGNYPTMATAVSQDAWYSWCSSQLISDQYKLRSDRGYQATPDHMIPMETAQDKKVPAAGEWQPKLVVGHNVGFDRSFIKEQYYIKGSRMRFLDTMSMHISVSGLTSLQRMLYVAQTKGSQRKEVKDHANIVRRRGFAPSFEWTHEASLNNLADVHKLYCKPATKLDKDPRNVFVKGTMADVRDNFQELMTYCATDVVSTHQVFCVLWPMFLQRMPHPVTLAGMLEMGTAYLPLNNNWPRYVHKAQTTYESLAGEISLLLQNLANHACQMTEKQTYKDDVWLWDLDWTRKGVKKSTAKETKKKKKDTIDEMSEELEPDQFVDEVYKKAKKMLRQPYMAGHPQWYVELCPPKSQLAEGDHPQPILLSTQRRVTPKLLRMTWDGFPLHYHVDHGWGFLVPDFSLDEVDRELQRQEREAKGDDTAATVFPFQSLIEVCRHTRPKWLKGAMTAEPPQDTLERVLSQLHGATGEEDQAKYWAELREISVSQGDKQKAKSQVQAPTLFSGAGPFYDVVPGCLFYRLPHKDGVELKVGNPLAKDFLGKIEEGILSSYSGSQPQTILKYSNMTSYWKNNMDRISGQMAVQLRKKDLPPVVTRSPEYDEDLFHGAIVPRVVPAGTVTRRAVEKTWLTASNAYRDRVGSELKAMVQSPPGYHFVGADVDSQELWIAAILGDAYFAGQHGCTAFGWMTLQGKKADGTDLHSKTASIVGISRDQAKVFNYGRIYGAGANFAERLLMQFNSRLTPGDAKRKAQAMYQATKGRKVFRKSPPDEDVPLAEVKGTKMLWDGGSESHMFNMLESIAMNPEPRTPILGCLISKALQPKHVNNEFMTSRINWVVQSSAVDYLHLMLVTMRWLLEEFNIDGRFCISIHDEVRYLIRSEDRYRAALALQITNLLTRAMFARKLGMNNLPQSVAFFSAVDIDKCLRKETHMDCVTPSNPRGLKEGYGIPAGEALTMQEILEKTNTSLSSTNQPKPARIRTRTGNQSTTREQSKTKEQEQGNDANLVSGEKDEESAEKTKLRGYKKHSEHEVFPVLE